MLYDFAHEPRIAYFSMEIALRSDIPTYAGGLGVLAGDTLRAAADLALPMVGVTLVSRAGYFRQEVDSDGLQREHPDEWDPAGFARSLDAKVAVVIEGRIVWIGGWLYVLEGRAPQPVILLDTDLEENRADDRTLTHYLYGGDEAYRLKQEIVLGIGGLRLLHALGFEVRKYHMNEGHSALLTLELLHRHAYAPTEVRAGEMLYDIPKVRAHCNFTTHTPVEAGHDKFSYELVGRVLENRIDVEQATGLADPARSRRSRLAVNESEIDLALLKRLGGEDGLNMTRLALNLSEFVNGVAKRHAEVSAQLFPDYRVHAITNGVHPNTWTTEAFAALYDRYLPSWRHEPEQLVRADCCLPDAVVLEAHAQAKQALIERVRADTGTALRADVPILGFARRMTAYKRPELLFTDLERLRRIARVHPFQVVFAGKAHPRDAEGKRLIEALHAHIRALVPDVPAAYLHDYDMTSAKLLAAGADVWLNTPLPPLEASGTSGMKAAFNGVPSLSVLDGWWVEGCIEGVTGWSIGASGEDDARSLYDKLERVVLPLYHEGREADGGWVKVMKGAISKNASYFNSHRMMRRYATEAYLRSGE
jgi:starch phosphorylase